MKHFLPFLGGKFIRRSPLFRLFIHFWCVVLYPCFLNCKIILQNLLELHSHLSKYWFEVVTRVYFWSTISNCGIHLVDNFSMPKYSYKILNTHSFVMFTFFAISCTFTRRSSYKMWWIYFLLFLQSWYQL